MFQSAAFICKHPMEMYQRARRSPCVLTPNQGGVPHDALRMPSALLCLFKTQKEAFGKPIRKREEGRIKGLRRRFLRRLIADDTAQSTAR